MKTLKALMLLIALIVPFNIHAHPLDGKIIAEVDATFSNTYPSGFDVTWEINNRKHLKPGMILSVEWEGGQYLTELIAFKVGFGGDFGIIYVPVIPLEVHIPNGAVIRVIR
jgi:hypothetical protein